MRRRASVRDLMLGLEELTRRDASFAAGDEDEETSGGITVQSDNVGEEENT